LNVFENPKTNEDFKELVMLSLNNLSSGSSEHILAILKTDFYEIIFNNLLSSNKKIQINSLLIIKNCISHYNFKIATKLIENGLFEKLFDILDVSDKDFSRVSILIKILESIIELGKYEIDPEDSSLLILRENNPYMENFVKMGGIDKLNNLQNIPNEDIYNKTIEFIEKYFKIEEY